MTEIKYRESRLPDENDVYEVYFTSHRSSGESHCGSIFFDPLDNGFREVACRLHGTREREDYLLKAAKLLIREKKEDVVYDKNGEVVAELVVRSQNTDNE